MILNLNNFMKKKFIRKRNLGQKFIFQEIYKKQKINKTWKQQNKSVLIKIVIQIYAIIQLVK